VKKKFILSAAQAQSVLYDPEQNLTKAEDIISKASDREVNGIIFPELFLTGYTTKKRVAEFAIPLNHKWIVKLENLAAKYRMMIVCGFPEASSTGQIFDSACIIDADGKQLGTYRKTHLFKDEAMVFSPGQEYKVFNTSLGKIGIMICYDLEFPEVARLLAILGAELVAVPTANMYPYNKHQSIYLRSRAMENGIFIGCANTTGSDSTYQYCGGSAIVSPAGKVLAFAELEEDMIMSQVDLKEVPPVDDNLQYLKHRRPDLYQSLVAKHDYNV
jgi:predicted amidohydrolase